MNYNYFGYTTDMKLVKGAVAAATEEEALGLIASYGHTILKLDAVKPFAPDLSKLLPSVKKVKPGQVIIFSRQLKLLIEAGVDIVSSLEMIQKQAGSPVFKKVLVEIVAEIRRGGRMSAAMSKYPAIFPPIYCRSVSVGEQTGELGLMLDQIADYMDSEVNNKKGLKNTLTYPLVVSVVAVGVVLLLVNFVLPTFEGLYSTMGAKMPALTTTVMSAAGWLRTYTLHLLVAGISTVMGITLYSRSKSGKYQLDKLSLTLPMVGMISRLRQLSYCCRTMAVLFRSGLSTTDIMQIIIDSSDNRFVAEALTDVQEDMLKGEGLSKPMSKHEVFLPMMVEMVRVGEETGGLDETLLMVAKTFDAEADDKTRTFNRLLQTTLTIGITVMVAVVVLSMMLAMYGIYGQINM
ncbi:MAG TPA: type II secretion system F family protein [Dehalococcoidales bacterium]